MDLQHTCNLELLAFVVRQILCRCGTMIYDEVRQMLGILHEARERATGVGLAHMGGQQKHTHTHKPLEEPY